MAETVQQWVNRQKAAGVTRDDIATAFRDAYGIDVRTVDADEDYDTFKAKHAAKHFVGPPAPKAAAEPAFKPPAPFDTALDVGLTSSLVPAAPATPPKAAPTTAADALAEAAKMGVLPKAKPTAASAALATAGKDIGKPVAPPPEGQEFEGPFGKVLTLPAKLVGAAKAFGELAAPAGMEYEPPLAAPAAKLREAARQDLETAAVEKVKPFREQMAAERAQRQLPDEGMSWANTAQVLGNAIKDLGVVVGGLAEVANEIAGITIVPKDETFGQAQERALRQGEELGAGMVGSTLGAVEGLKWGEGLATHPFTTLLTLEPLFGSLKGTPGAIGVDAARKIATDRLAKPLIRMALEKLPPVGWVDEAGLPMWPKRVVAAVQDVFTNGVIQADPRMAAILDGLMHGAESARSALNNIAEGMARQMAKGKAKPVAPQLERVELGLIPAGESRVAKVAQAEAAAAMEAAERAKAKAAQAEVAATPEGATPPPEPRLSPETALAEVPAERVAAFDQAEKIKRAVADALNLSAAGGTVAAIEMIKRIKRDPAAAHAEILAMSRRAAEKLDQGREALLYEEIAPTAADAAREVPVVEATIEPTAAEVAAKGLAEMLAKEAAEAADVAAEAARQAESAGVLPQVEAGGVNVPPGRAVMGGALDGPDAFTAPNIGRTFGVSRDVAEATVAIADAMGLDKSRIRLAKGGTPGAGALTQADGAKPSFYDNILRALPQWQPKGTPEQLLAYLGKVKGAMAEADWIGLRDWLKDKKSVTREEVAKFVNDNKVEVRDVRPVGREYRDYATKGGDGYTELLLTMPERVEGSNLDKASVIRQRYAVELGEAESRLTKARDQRSREIARDGHASELAESEIDAAHAALEALHANLRQKMNDPKIVGENYRGPHWVEPNVLAHVRAQTFTDTAGRRVLFLDEVQSDWHQAGKKRGYITGDPNEYLFRVPDAPFKGAAWPELALKRMLLWAAEHGYDGIAWTTGEMQSRRYGKSTVVDSLLYVKNEDGSLFVKAYDDVGNRLMDEPAASLADVKKTLGDKIAGIIARGEGAESAPGSSIRTLDGMAMEVASPAMQSFYDRQLPATANDIAKKFGGKVERTSVDIAGVEHDVPFLATPPEMRSAVAEQGLPLFQPAKGAVEFLADGTALIRALKSPDASTGVHELSHIARRWVLNEEGGFTPDQIKHAEDWAGAKGGVWDRPAEEKFARGFERYLHDGVAPTAKLAQIFAKFKDWLGKIYAKLTGSEIDLTISPEMRGVYDALVQRGVPEQTRRLVAKADLAVQQGQRLDLHDLLPEVPKTRRLAIEEAATAASKAKRDALAAGFDLDKAPALKAATASRDAADVAKAKSASAADLAKWVAKNDLPADASVYQIGRKVADYMLGRNIDAAPAGLAQVLRDLGVPEKAAAPAAAFLMAEAEFGQRAKMIDLSYGGPRRPTAEVEQFGVTPGGGLIQHRAALQMAADRKAVDAPTAPALRGQQTFYEMASRQLPEEPPKPARTDNPAVNRALDEVARVVKDAYYPQQRTPTWERSVSPIEQEVGFPAPDIFERQIDQGLKELTPERIGQRVLDAFDDDSTQTLRHSKIRKAAIDLVRERAQKAGMSAPAIRKMLGEWLAQLEDTKRVSAISKSRFPELVAPNGTDLFTRKDMAAVNAKASPKVKAEVMRSVVSDMAEAAFGTQVLRDLSAELYRFMTDKDGTPNPAAIGTVGRYAEELAKRVLGQGEVYPMAMPYSGVKVASELRRMASEAGDAAQAVKLERLADWALRYVPASETGGLAKHVGAWWKDLMRGTDPPPKMVNVHVEPGALKALNAHFASLSSAESPGWLGLVRALGQHAKKMVVAANVPTLVNNNIANTIVQGIRRADPMQPVKTFQALAAYKAFKDGRAADVDPRLRRILAALDQTDMLAHSELSADIGKTDLGRHMEAAMPGVGTARRKLSVSTRGFSDIAPEAWAKLTDGLAQAYTKLGDTPFRLEEALNAYDAFESKVKDLDVGEWLELKQGVGRKVRVERTDTGYTIADVSGPHANRRISFTEAEGLQSQAMTKALAQAANVAQEAVFFDYNRIGNLGKYLRGGSLSLLSGIFAWFMKAVDIPFVKRGLVREMMAAPYEVTTNSAAVLARQATDNMTLALRRQAVVAAAQSATVAQRQSEDLRRAMGYNPAELGMMLKFATNPASMGEGMDPTRVWARNVSPVVSSMPTSTMLGAVQAFAAKQAYGDVLSNPAATLAALQPDATLTDPQRKAKKMLMQMARGEMLSPAQLVQMFGLGGGPLLTLLERIKNAGRRGQTVTPHEIAMEWAKLTFGATPVKALDVGAAAVGQATGARDSWPATWSSYGKTFARQGFHGGQPQDDEAGFVRWVLRQMVGAGYALVPLETTQNVETGRRAEGALERYLDQASAAAKATLTAEAKRRANLAARALQDDPESWALKQEHTDAVNRVLNIESVIKSEFAQYKDQLRAQAKALALDKLR